ncbi:DUF58 domain-containing protein [Brevibacterium sp. BRM-1]|uniref:DUF58 domain-containing protein n=1 Tax=Brevibacterium sp. BRM-1 TaxID=2999062 RepID=UPI002282F533|nr:DUF58 domain-containing protein [Brevibacterium sp. BRM-1]WAL41094.1 DUF58 domain-containing protein [Brevibacterium sp. BRM-1]
MTASGIVFAVIGVALIVLAYVFGLPGLLPAGILLLALVLCSGLAGLLASRRLEARVTTTGRSCDGIALARVGEDLDLRLSLRNRSPLPVGGFVVAFAPRPGFGAEQSARMRGLAAGAGVGIEAGFSPTRRGMSGLERTSLDLVGPFGLTAVRSTLTGPFDVAVAPQDLDVPARRRPGVPVALREEQRLVRGASTRDFQTREYVPGDDLRHIHWATTARLGDLVVREEAQEESPGALVVLETTAEPDEDLIAAAAAGVRVLLDQGLEVRLAWGAEHRSLRGAAGAARLDLVAARLGPGPAEVRREDLQGVAEVFIAADDPQARARLAAALPRSAAARVWDPAELSGTGSELFGREIGVPASWLQTGRSVR